MEGPIAKTLPQSIEAEQSVLGSMLISRNAIAPAAEKLEEEDFYRDSHKVLFKSIVEMFKRDMAVDLITVLEYLKSTDVLERAGGVTYVTEISASVPSTANLSSYIQIVLEKSTLRKLIRA
ncbi:MAG: DnaB-like helicase N-terminal domain-containing protein, partial [Clostridium sp.]|uniref:DnaB-like helicase N-terminal domain-containing protein n=1 Tax=Clostridium sp. TaxID=1506 RepID=UPI003EE587C6